MILCAVKSKLEQILCSAQLISQTSTKLLGININKLLRLAQEMELLGMVLASGCHEEITETLRAENQSWNLCHKA